MGFYADRPIAVGVMMVGFIRRVDFDDWAEFLPAFSTVALMAFTYNIANGLTAGFILSRVAKLLAGRGREISSGSILLGALCSVYYLFGLPH
jgi:AGZA family xanthine/uracil permease-like MFS transporter